MRFQRPSLPAAADIERHFARSRSSRWFSNGGPCVREFASELERFIGDAVHVIPVCSGTAGLMVALAGLLGEDADPRPLIAMPSYTFVATLNAVLWCGRKPLFVDVESDSWHMDPAALARAAEQHGDRIAAVLACSTFGVPPSPEVVASWQQISDSLGVALLVDSAAGFGAIDAAGAPLGRNGAAEVFSFHATKPLAIGEGGAIATRSTALAQRFARLANFGLEGPGRVTDARGLNAKMSELHGAVGLAALEHFDSQLQARRARATEIHRRLKPSGYDFQKGPSTCAWQFVPALAPGAAARHRALTLAAEREIELRTYHYPLHRMPAFVGRGEPMSLPVTEDLASRALSLPMAADLTGDEVDAIVDTLLAAVQL